MMRSFHQLCVWALPLVSLTAAKQQYLKPAPVSVIKPDPSAYHDYLPELHGQGDFSHKNDSVTPWRPISPGPLPPLSQPVCGVQKPSPQSQFWLPQLPARNQGHSPFLVGGKDYKVYRNVKDYGAVGDGKHDDTNAINRAITDQSRMAGGNGPGGTTGQPALIYIPSGTYKVTSSIQLFIDTQVIGDPINPPIIKAAPVFKDQTPVVNGYDYGQGSTTNFYIGLRNVILDTTAADHSSTIYALNWAVSQATNLINVEFVMPENSQHIGIEMNGGSSGGGSGTHMGNLTFSGGLIGLLFNNQQYALKNLKFSNVNTAIAISHAFIISMQGIECTGVGICVDAGASGVTGSVSLIDSSCTQCGIVVNGTSTFLLENIAVADSGPILLYDGVSRLNEDLVGKTYTAGHYFPKTTGSPIITNGTILPYTKRGSLTDSTGKYFTKEQPQYTDYPASAFASVKDAGAHGDGVHDDTAAIQRALLANANCKITYFPYGVYVITKTLYIPPGSRIVGEVWSIVTASGNFFADASNPQPMFQVGKPGDVGVAEISDMLFTVAEILPGAIIVEVNMAGQNQGDVSFHNSHFRIGGAADSKTETTCQSDNPPCKAAFMVLHLGETSSTYIENSWLWSADHDLDGNYNQVIGTGRGAYVQATKATWLIGIGSEHHTLYAMQFANAQNVFMSMLQVETPYWQPVPQAPSPWSPNATWNDPTFSGANSSIPQSYMQWSLRVVGSKSHTLNLYGQGFWVFFNNLGACTGPDGDCQVSIVDLEQLQKGSGVEIYALNTRGVENMIILNGSGGTPAVTTAQNPGSWGGVIAGYLGFE